MMDRRQFTQTASALAGSLWLGSGHPPLFAQPRGPSANANVLQVGPGRAIKTIAESSRLAREFDTVEVDAGDYAGDVAVWELDGVTVRAVGGRVRLRAQGAAAEGKGIWVVRANGMRVEGFDFEGSRVSDQNGAGIRFEKGRLLVRDCSFTDNENGILTSNQPDAELEIENSEFGHNGHGDGLSHNLYVGAIARLTVTGSYFHHARVGHLLKSRAAENRIFYNRLTDEAAGRASYELEFANGGIAYVVGNIIQQSAKTENHHLVSYGAEGYNSPKNELYLINNTLVDDRPQGGVFLRIAPGQVTVKVVNNLMVGQGRFDVAVPGDYRNNLKLTWSDFEMSASDDFRLKRNSKAVGKMVDAGRANDVSLQMRAEYVHPMSTKPLTGKHHNPGGVQRMRPATKP